MCLFTLMLFLYVYFQHSSLYSFIINVKTSEIMFSLSVFLGSAIRIALDLSLHICVVYVNVGYRSYGLMPATYNICKECCKECLTYN